MYWLLFLLMIPCFFLISDPIALLVIIDSILCIGSIVLIKRNVRSIEATVKLVLIQWLLLFLVLVAMGLGNRFEEGILSHLFATGFLVMKMGLGIFPRQWIDFLDGQDESSIFLAFPYAAFIIYFISDVIQIGNIVNLSFLFYAVSGLVLVTSLVSLAQNHLNRLYGYLCSFPVALAFLGTIKGEQTLSLSLLGVSAILLGSSIYVSKKRGLESVDSFGEEGFVLLLPLLTLFISADLFLPWIFLSDSIEANYEIITGTILWFSVSLVQYRLLRYRILTKSLAS